MKIDNKYSIEKDSIDGVKLVFQEKRIKNKGTDKEEEYLYITTVGYYMNVSHALKKYLNLQIEPAENIEDCINLIEDTYKKILQLSFDKQLN